MLNFRGVAKKRESSLPTINFLAGPWLLCFFLQTETSCSWRCAIDHFTTPGKPNLSECTVFLTIPNWSLDEPSNHKEIQRLTKHTSWKINMQSEKMEVWKMISFSIGWFLSSILIFWGVCECLFLLEIFVLYYHGLHRFGLEYSFGSLKIFQPHHDSQNLRIW